MRPVSDAFGRTVRGSHKAVFRARVCTTFQSGTDPTGTDIPIISGDVQLDATADVRATLDLTTDGNGAVFRSGELLTPYGNEIFVERGVEYGNGTREWVSLGYFRINSVEQDIVPNGPVRIMAADRMAGIVDARRMQPRQFDITSTFSGVFTTMVHEVYPGAVLSFDFDAVGTNLTRTAILEEDRYGYLRDLATAFGKVMYFDHEGHLRVESPPDPTDPVFDVNHGANGVLIAMSRALTREGVYNAVFAAGEGTDTTAPVWAIAKDLNPFSPTYWFGTFGKVPHFYGSPHLTTGRKAVDAASSLLRQVIGLPYNADFTAVPNPALEPLDPVRVAYSDRRAAEVHVIERLTIPLTADQPLTATTREQTTVTIGTEES